MAELNLKQITDKLNSEFTGEVRKLVFWYDANAEFAEDVDTMELTNAKVLHLAPDNQFYTKYFLEKVDTTTNYLVYAPFAKPPIRENHLADTIRYSKEFFADRASLLTIDLGIDERYKGLIQKYIKFFGEKKRTQAFYDLELEVFNPNTIEVGLMSVLCKCKTPSYEEVLRTVLTGEGLEENRYLAEFKKYDLLEAFWRQAEETFGYVDEEPTLEKFTLTMFVTYVSRDLKGEIPPGWKPFVSFKSGSVMTFLDNLMNNALYGRRFDEISDEVYAKLKGETEFAKLPVESLVSCGLFAGIDRLLIQWMIQRLEMEDVGVKLEDLTIPQLIKRRRQGHFGRQYRAAYFVLENAWHMISMGQYQAAHSLQDLVKNYTESLYQMDRRYRYFYFYLDQVEDTTAFEKLKNLVENIYTNEYLTKVCVNWNDHYAQDFDTLPVLKQKDFYGRYLHAAREQTVVIISDAMRYEVGVSLLEKLQADEKCEAEIKPALSVLPSTTQYGMAALLPHEKLEVTPDCAVLVDGQKADTLEQRQKILQKYKPASKCVQYDEIRGVSQAELRSVFTRQDVVYVYHNQIDARGDKLATENEVFRACEEAVEEISGLIRRLTTSANRSRFIVTSDHGFLYKRNKLQESDKISLTGAKADSGRRYVIADAPLDAVGVTSVPLGKTLRNEDPRVVSCPVGADVFKVPGSGINYVHGGSSPQEILIPVIEVRTQKSHKETTVVQVSLVSLTSKITNLIVSLDFMQSEPVSDVVKETSYRIYFVSDDGEKISNEHIYVADKKDKDAVKRVFRLKFSFKNKKYDKKRKYYLIACDDATGVESLRHEVVMDLAFADDFGFGI